MTLEIISDAPETESFTPLPAHESRTPVSFFGGKPVLHFEDKHARLVISNNQLNSLPFLRSAEIAGDGASTATSNGHDDSEAEVSQRRDVLVSDIGVWVSSERFILYNFSGSAGISIPYPSILLHAIQRRHIPGASPEIEEQGIYMQIANPTSSETFDADADYDEDDVVDLTIFPSAQSDGSSSQPTASNPPVDEVTEGTSSTNQTPIQRFFAGLSTCSNLHPDPAGMNSADSLDDDVSDDEDPIIFEGSVGYNSALLPTSSRDDGLPPPFPGSSGWITAENVDEYFDEDGNWRNNAVQPGGGGGGGGSLGPGAGTVRPRGEIDPPAAAPLNEPDDARNGGTNDDHGGGDVVVDDDDMALKEGTKWRRTE